MTRFIRGNALFLFGAALLIPPVYWVSLKMMFPGYFSPLNPFHLDFYDYVGTQTKSFAQILTRYPRPVAFLAMKILGGGDVKNLIVCEIALAWFNILLTIALVRQILSPRKGWSLFSVVAYLALLFTHPDFYFEHRHDLPAEVSYLFLMLSLISWVSWARMPRGPLLAVSVLCVVCFVLSKESFFAAALSLLLGIALVDRDSRNHHLRMLGLIFFLELASLGWSKHLNGPFVAATTDRHATYFVDLAARSLIETYGFYLFHLVTPALIVLLLWALWRIRRSPKELIFGIVLIAAGLSVFVTHAVLPNHRYEEYAWIGAPLFFAPILLLRPWSETWRAAAGYASLLTLTTLVAILGPGGYRQRYNTEVLRWMVDQDIRSGLLLKSLDRFDSLRGRSADMIVSGLDDAAVPWQVAEYVRWRFGPDLHWTVAFPPNVRLRYNSPSVRFVDASLVQLDSTGYLAIYETSGQLLSLMPVAGIDVTKPIEEILIPAFSPLEARLRIQPDDSALLMQCADLAVTWGFWTRAKLCLDSVQGDATRDQTYTRIRRTIPAHR